MIVQFTRGWQQYNAGEQAGFPKSIADVLVKNRVASMVGEAQKPDVMVDPPKAEQPKGFANKSKAA
jgi:hypothetical protein